MERASGSARLLGQCELRAHTVAALDRLDLGHRPGDGGAGAHAEDLAGDDGEGRADGAEHPRVVHLVLQVLHVVVVVRELVVLQQRLVVEHLVRVRVRVRVRARVRARFIVRVRVTVRVRVRPPAEMAERSRGVLGAGGPPRLGRCGEAPGTGAR